MNSGMGDRFRERIRTPEQNLEQRNRKIEELRTEQDNRKEKKTVEGVETRKRGTDRTKSNGKAEWRKTGHSGMEEGLRN